MSEEPDGPLTERRVSRRTSGTGPAWCARSATVLPSRSGEACKPVAERGCGPRYRRKEPARRSPPVPAGLGRTEVVATPLMRHCWARCVIMCLRGHPRQPYNWACTYASTNCSPGTAALQARRRGSGEETAPATPPLLQASEAERADELLTEHFRQIGSRSADARARTFWNSAQRWLGVVLIPSGGVYLRLAAIYTAGRNRVEPLLRDTVAAKTRTPSRVSLGTVQCGTATTTVRSNKDN